MTAALIVLLAIALMGVAFALGVAVATRATTPMQNKLDYYEDALEQIADGPVSEPQILAFFTLDRLRQIGK
jgi:hypothetical protein